MTSYFAAESTKQLQLLKFHMKRMEDNFENIVAENGNLTNLTKAQSIFTSMQMSSCRRFPFEGPLGEYLYKEEAADYPVQLSKPDLERMSPDALQELCKQFAFSCRRKYMRFRQTSKQEIVDRLHEAIQRRAAFSKYPMGSCAKDKQCPLKHSSCRSAAVDSNAKRCSCKRGYCFRTSNAGDYKCHKPKGRNRNRAINALLQWTRRMELRLGLVARELKKIDFSGRMSD